MSAPKALLTFSIGPVHAFIAQARRISDVWAGSNLLSHLMGRAIATARDLGGEPVFPAVEGQDEDVGIPNRVVCRVPRQHAGEIARRMESAVRVEWETLVVEAVEVLREHGLAPSTSLSTPADGKRADVPRQTDHVFQASWSWVPEAEGYAAASASGARLYAASRTYRAFVQVEQHGEKCALCGERTALPDGDRATVRTAWKRIEEETVDENERRFLRFDQGRLCLVCATKRLYTKNREEKRVYFTAFDRFDQEARGPEGGKEGKRERAPYVALVNLDGDRMGQVLSWGTDEIAGGAEGVSRFHRALSRALGQFARSLRRSTARDSLERAQLNLDTLGVRSRARRSQWPQLIYAGGDDVLVVCAPADALPVAQALRRHYLNTLAPLRDLLVRPERIDQLTLSGAILFAHGRHPAGAMLTDVHDLLERKAKGEAGRNALAIRLDKRSGVPVVVAFRWDEPAGAAEGARWPEALGDLVSSIASGELGSTLSFNLRREERVLVSAFGPRPDRWQPWLRDRLSRSGVSDQHAEGLAERITPFFVHDHAAALRIARFLGREMTRHPGEAGS